MITREAITHALQFAHRLAPGEVYEIHTLENEHNGGWITSADGFFRQCYDSLGVRLTARQRTVGRFIGIVHEDGAFLIRLADVESAERRPTG